MTGAFVASPELGLHTLESRGPAGRHRALPPRQRPVRFHPSELDSHRSDDAGLRPDQGAPGRTRRSWRRCSLPSTDLYPGGAMRLAPADDAAMASEYACSGLVVPAARERGQGAHRLPEQPVEQRLRARHLGAGGGLPARRVVHRIRGPPGSRRPVRLRVDRRVRPLRGGARPRPEGAPLLLPLGLSHEDLPRVPGHDRSHAARAVPGLPGRALLPHRTESGLQPGDVAPCARCRHRLLDSQAGLVAMSRHPSNTSGGNFVTTFDKSVFPGQEYVGDGSSTGPSSATSS